MRVTATDPNARTPKGVYYGTRIDLYVTDLIEEENGLLVYNTGISVSIPDGHVLEMHPNPRLVARGYCILNQAIGSNQPVKVFLCRVANGRQGGLKRFCVGQLVLRKVAEEVPIY